jgi:hypothetical protein
VLNFFNYVKALMITIAEKTKVEKVPRYYVKSVLWWLPMPARRGWKLWLDFHMAPQQCCPLAALAGILFENSEAGA